jgi:hypothetical protein
MILVGCDGITLPGLVLPLWFSSRIQALGIRVVRAFREIEMLVLKRSVWPALLAGWLHWNGKQWPARTLAPPAKGTLGPYLGSPGGQSPPSPVSGER